MEYDDLFYERLIKLRTQKGVSARDMSLSLGQSESYINKIENRKTFPSMSGFFYICEYLNIHPSELFNDDIENPAKIKEFITEFNKLDEKQLEHIMAIIKDLNKLKL